VRAATARIPPIDSAATRAYDDHRRLMNRLTLAGDVPLGVDGGRSIIRTGNAGHFSGL
jgi:taurine dioxygenase